MIRSGFRPLLLVGVFVWWLASVAGAENPAPADAGELRVMSFNIRNSGAKDGANAWPLRREIFCSVVREFRPALAGFQEVLADQFDDLARALPEFAFAGVARDDGKRKGEWALIAYRKDRFTVVAEGNFWLSEQPEVPGSKGWDAAYTRICSWVRLKDRSTGRELLYANTHFDNKGKLARRNSSRLLSTRLQGLANDGPVILTGDFNASEDDPAVQLLMHPAAPDLISWTDSYREVHADRTADEASFHGFKGTVKGSRIDFILHSSQFVAVAADIDRSDAGSGHWPSDHFAVTAVLRFK